MGTTHGWGAVVDRQENSHQDGEDAAAPDGDCLRHFVGRQEDIRRALDGRSLRVLLDYVDRGVTCRIMFTRDGHTVSVPDGQRLDPHVEIRGTHEEVRAFLLGEVDILQAVVARVVVLHIEIDEVSGYQGIRRLVADAVR